MINLFENCLEKEKDLIRSLQIAGYTHPTVVLNDEGYLPSNVLSPVSYFTQMNQIIEGYPLFFNEVPVPAYWEIRGDGKKAEIYEGYKLKGLIHYSQRPGDYRAVRAVEWLNDQEKVRSIDLYNQYGILFGKKTYSDGRLTLTTYFNNQNQEAVLFNHVTNTIQVNYEGKHYIFESYTAFIIFFFEVSQLDVSQMFYNSLGMPFFVSGALKRKSLNKEYEHTLFWQENSEKIPGNMAALLSDPLSPTRHIVVQDKGEYARLQGQIPSRTSTSVEYLGYIFDFKSREKLDKNLFIMTNSDEIHNLDMLIRELPHYNFHIAARTAMSKRLLSYEQFSNVSLYPAIEEAKFEQLIDQSSIYLDINGGNEVDNMIRKAFNGSQLIFSFSDTVHNERYIHPEHIVAGHHPEYLVEKIKRATQSKALYQKLLRQQWHHGGQSTIKDYKDVLK